MGISMIIEESVEKEGGVENGQNLLFLLAFFLPLLFCIHLPMYQVLCGGL